MINHLNKLLLPLKTLWLRRTIVAIVPLMLAANILSQVGILRFRDELSVLLLKNLKINQI